MTKDLKHYLALIAFLSIGLGCFLLFNYNRQIQIGIALIMSAVYVVWGIVHHSIKKELHIRIILEYVLVATVASVIVVFLLMRT
ncbi:MAG TPA: hypothetical protein VMY36_01595 [Patescibacteria group bacterium]|nr:hypothetical protein [Patescibacteria group bacterium]